MIYKKGDRVRVIQAEPKGFPVGTLADVFWTGHGRGQSQRVGLEDDKRRRVFMGAERVQLIDVTGATEATQRMAAGVYSLIARYMDQTMQNTQKDGSITVTGRVRVKDVQHSDELDQLPADIHGIYPNVRYTVDVERGDQVFRFNCLASREVA